jgi:hypothetical protein
MVTETVEQVAVLEASSKKLNGCCAITAKQELASIDAENSRISPSFLEGERYFYNHHSVPLVNQKSGSKPS